MEDIAEAAGSKHEGNASDEEEQDEAFLERMQNARLARRAETSGATPTPTRGGVGGRGVGVGRQGGPRLRSESGGIVARPGSARAHGGGGGGGLASGCRRRGLVVPDHRLHGEFQTYDSNDPLDADPWGGGPSGDGDGDGGAYGVPARIQTGISSEHFTRRSLPLPSYPRSLSPSSPAHSLHGGVDVSVGASRTHNSDPAGTSKDALGFATGSSTRAVLATGGTRRSSFGSDGCGFGTGRSGDGGTASEANAGLDWWPNDSRRQRECGTKAAFDTTPFTVSYPLFAEPRTPRTNGGRQTCGGKSNGSWQLLSLGKDAGTLSDISRQRAAVVYGGNTPISRSLGGRASRAATALLSPVLGARAAGRGHLASATPPVPNAPARPSSATNRPTSATRGVYRPSTAGSGGGGAGTLRDIPEAMSNRRDGNKSAAAAFAHPPHWKPPHLAATAAAAVHTQRVKPAHKRHSRPTSAPAYDALKPMFGPGHRSQCSGGYEAIGRSSLLPARHGITMQEVLSAQRRARITFSQEDALALGTPRGATARQGGGDGSGASVSPSTSASVCASESPPHGSLHATNVAAAMTCDAGKDFADEDEGSERRGGESHIQHVDVSESVDTEEDEDVLAELDAEAEKD